MSVQRIWSTVVLSAKSPVLIFVHVGKCGGLSLRSALEESPVVRRKFRKVKRVHTWKPSFRPAAHYAFAVRNPIDRAVSAFNWRLKLVNSEVDPRSRFPGEFDALTKYGSLNALAESLYLRERPNLEAQQDWMKIHHLRESFRFYLEDIVQLIPRSHIFGVFATEFLSEEIVAKLGVEPVRLNESQATDRESSAKSLSCLARTNLGNFLRADYYWLNKLFGKARVPHLKRQVLLNI